MEYGLTTEQADVGAAPVVDVRRDGYVTTIVIQRPDVLNARNHATRSAISNALQDADADPEVRVIVLTGSGRAFSTGLDLRDLADGAPQPEQPAMDLAAIMSTDKPVIAAINGFALGGGLELALACDIRIAAESAVLGLTEVSRGRIPGSGGTQRLPRIIGPAAAMFLIMTGRKIGADEAHRLGLVAEVVPGEELPGRAAEVAVEIARNAPLAVMAAKEAVLGGLGLHLDEALLLERKLSARIEKTDDCREGMVAFREKRDPHWTGR